MARSCCLGLLVAWVLWTHNYFGSGKSEPVGAYDTRAQCMASVKDELVFWRRYKQPANPVLDVTMNEGDGRLAVIFKDGSIFTLQCLPDTVDPRSKSEK